MVNHTNAFHCHERRVDSCIAVADDFKCKKALGIHPSHYLDVG